MVLNLLYDIKLFKNLIKTIYSLTLKNEHTQSCVHFQILLFKRRKGQYAAEDCWNIPDLLTLQLSQFSLKDLNTSYVSEIILNYNEMSQQNMVNRKIKLTKGSEHIQFHFVSCLKKSQMLLNTILFLIKTCAWKNERERESKNMWLSPFQTPKVNYFLEPTQYASENTCFRWRWHGWHDLSKVR